VYFATRHYKTTFSTHYKAMAEEEEGMGAGLAWPACSADLFPTENV